MASSSSSSSTVSPISPASSSGHANYPPNPIPPRSSSAYRTPHTSLTSRPTSNHWSPRSRHSITQAFLNPLPEATWFAQTDSVCAGATGYLAPNSKSSTSGLSLRARTKSHYFDPDRYYHSLRDHPSQPTPPPSTPELRRPASVNILSSPVAEMSSSSADSPPPPSPNPERYATADFNFGVSSRPWCPLKEKVVRGPFEYLHGHPGKEVRKELIKAFDAFLSVPTQSLYVITKVVGMLHTASLLVDDVEDYSSLRRGLPVAHKIFGVPQTINSANYIYFCALQELQLCGRPADAISIFADELVNLHRGQGMDLFWRDTLTCPTEDEYLEMVANKTGGLFRLAIKLMQSESASTIDCVPLVNIIGLIFQIQDDYRNLRSDEYSAHKGMCEDLTEGKFSFPVIHSIRSDPTNLQLLNILRQKTVDDKVKRYAVDYMERTGSFAYTRQTLAVLIRRARAMVDELDQGCGRAAAIHKVLDKLEI